MSRITWKHVLGSAVLAGVAGCTPTINTGGQFMGTLGDKEIGMGQTFAVFEPGAVHATVFGDYEPISLPDNQVLGLVRHPGGDVPATFLATYLDVDADQIADQIDLTLTYQDTHTADVTLLKEDAYDDYRCWRDQNGLGTGCWTVIDIHPDCSVTPLGGNQFDVAATLRYRDADGGPNPGGSFGFSRQAIPNNDNTFGSAPIPGSAAPLTGFPNGFTVATTGTPEDGTFEISTTVALEPGATDGKLVFYPIIGPDGQDVAAYSDIGIPSCPLL